MARSLLDLHESTEVVAVASRDTRISRVAAGALALAVSVLAIGTLVVTRSDAALAPAGVNAEGSLAAGTLTLTDDDGGRSLFDLADLAPRRPVVSCIQIGYEGTIVPVDLAVRAEATGELAPYLDVTVEQGRGGGFDTCTGFEPETEVFVGTLQQLAASGWIGLDQILNTEDRRTYRISFELQDTGEAQGRSTSASFVWEVAPS